MLQSPAAALRVEHAGTVDAQSGRRLGAIAAGAHRSVDIGPQLQAAQGHRAASVHTHPGSSSFSTDDVQLLLEEAVLEVVTAVGADGTWYVVSIEPRGTPPPVPHMETQYDVAMQLRARPYRALVRLGVLTRDEAWRELTHVAWQVIAPALGLRYDRIEATP